MAARARTVLSVITEARTLADEVSSEHTSAAQALEWASAGFAELWAMLVAANADRYIATTPDTVTTTAGTLVYALEDEVMQVRRVDLVEGSARYPVERFSFQEAPYRNTYPTVDTGGFPRYAIVGQGVDGSDSSIMFDPDPGARTFEIWYVQSPPVITDSSDEFDGVAGWESWVVCYVALRMMIRSETDPSYVQAEMARIEARIKSSSAKRDTSRATRVADVRHRTAARGRWW